MDQLLDIVKEFLEEYPKAKRQLLEWQKKMLLAFQKMAIPDTELDEDFVIPPIDDASAEQMLFMTFLVNHRSLYDFFDGVNQKVFIEGQNELYTGTLNGEKMEETFKTRTEAEQALFKKAIEKIENQ